MTQTANAFPAKRFFVDMLVRDIELTDSILDLLDNCVDGAMRTATKLANPVKPYEGRWAKISFNENGFEIEDNCGGIPLQIAKEYAFRMGRKDASRDVDLPTVGVYGIGMKRAIFKIGHESTVESNTTNESFTVAINRKWMEDDNAWELPISVGKPKSTDSGTKIKVTDLRDGISRLFSDDTDFAEDLKKEISAYYSIILDKGFSVSVNGEKIEPIQVALQLDKEAFKESEGIVPYVYESDKDGISVSLAIGFYRDMPTDAEEEDALAGKPMSSKAGITIVCNDRVVVYADKTRMTGWGEATVPQYHTQFISIAGVVEFRSNDANKLPLTTTKRGIDGNSELYLIVKEFIREGLKYFTDYTNKWKRASRERTAIHSRGTAVAVKSVAALIPAAKWSKVTKGIGGRKFRPSLPLPKDEDPMRQLKFSRLQSQIRAVSVYLFDDPTQSPTDVGAKCFDDVLAKAGS